MEIFYSSSTRGFFFSNIHKVIPEDAKTVLEDTYKNLLEGQSQGKVIGPDPDGNPVLTDPVPVVITPTSISFAQLLIGLVTESWITAEEGRAWRDRVALPAQVVALINTLPTEQQFAAETRAMAPSVVLRNDPLVIGMGTAAGKTQEELDTFFRTYAEV